MWPHSTPSGFDFNDFESTLPKVAFTKSTAFLCKWILEDFLQFFLSIFLCKNLPLPPWLNPSPKITIKTNINLPSLYRRICFDGKMSKSFLYIFQCNPPPNTTTLWFHTDFLADLFLRRFLKIFQNLPIIPNYLHLKKGHGPSILHLNPLCLRWYLSGLWKVYRETGRKRDGRKTKWDQKKFSARVS